MHTIETLSFSNILLLRPELAVCLDQLDVTARVLPCQHTFCKRCLESIVQAHKELRCPECRIVVRVANVSDLPTNILLIRLLEGLRKKHKLFIGSRNSRSSRRCTSRPGFRIGKEIFSQSSSSKPPINEFATNGYDKRVPVAPNQPASNAVIEERRTVPQEVTNPKTFIATSNCPRVVPPASTLPKQEVRRDTSLYSTPTSCRQPPVQQQPHPDSRFRTLYRQTDSLPFNRPFARSNSHDFLTSVNQLPGNDATVTCYLTPNRTKSLSRPTSRDGAKHSTLPNRSVRVSPERVSGCSSASSLPKQVKAAHLPNPQPFCANLTIGNPLYGYISERSRQTNASPKPVVPLPESYLRALSAVQNSEKGQNQRKVQALYSCIGETANELTFESDAIITNGMLFHRLLLSDTH